MYPTNLDSLYYGSNLSGKTPEEIANYHNNSINSFTNLKSGYFDKLLQKALVYPVSLFKGWSPEFRDQVLDSIEQDWNKTKASEKARNMFEAPKESTLETALNNIFHVTDAASGASTLGSGFSAVSNAAKLPAKKALVTAAKGKVDDALERQAKVKASKAANPTLTEYSKLVEDYTKKKEAWKDSTKALDDLGYKTPDEKLLKAAEKDAVKKFDAMTEVKKEINTITPKADRVKKFYDEGLSAIADQIKFGNRVLDKTATSYKKGLNDTLYDAYKTLTTPLFMLSSNAAGQIENQLPDDAASVLAKNFETATSSKPLLEQPINSNLKPENSITNNFDENALVSGYLDKYLSQPGNTLLHSLAEPDENKQSALDIFNDRLNDLDKQIANAKTQEQLLAIERARQDEIKARLRKEAMYNPLFWLGNLIAAPFKLRYRGMSPVQGWEEDLNALVQSDPEYSNSANKINDIIKNIPTERENLLTRKELLVQAMKNSYDQAKLEDLRNRYAHQIEYWKKRVEVADSTIERNLALAELSKAQQALSSIALSKFNNINNGQL